MKRGILFAAVLIFASVLSDASEMQMIASEDKSTANHRLPDGLTKSAFANPPKEARPQVWWWWLQTSTNRQAITRDLEEMKAKGLSGCLIMDGGVAPFGPNKWQQKTIIGETEISYEPTSEYSGGTLTQAPAGMVQWSPEWRKMIRFASLEAGRLGLDLGVFIGPAGCAAPWVTPAYGQQELVWCETLVTESDRNAIVLPTPKYGKDFNTKPSPTEVMAQSSNYHDIAVLVAPAKGLIRNRDVQDLSHLLDDDGQLNWKAPSGDWMIYRFGYRPTGRNLAGVFYIDHLSLEAFDKHWENTVGLLLNEMSPEERMAFNYVECDSWEAGNPNWTRTFPAEFKQRRGYDLIRFLPVLAGRTIESDDQSASVRNDYRLTISDLIVNNHYKKQKEVANANGLKSYAEAAGPHQFQADVIKCVGNCDVAMGEFWMPSPHRPGPPARFLVREAATAAHIYGMNKVFAESFTSVGPNWEESPFTMKAAADQAFCDGLNWICFHTFSHHPSLTDKPGLTHSAGTHFDPTITWWDQSGSFVDYLSRCSYLLQKGLFVADVLFYQGDGIKMSDSAEKLNAFVWEDGLKNPPATLGKGYDYDKCNEDVLLTRLSVKDGKLVLPDGMSYRVLGLDKKKPVSLGALHKMAELVEAGATIVGEAPLASRSKKDDANEYNQLIGRLWGKPGEKEKRTGKGRVIRACSIREVVQRDGIGPDFGCSGLSVKGVIDYIHRRDGDADIYFLASRWQPVEKVEATFRVTGKQPELWDAVTGKVRDLPDFRQENGRTIVPLEFDPCESFFIVFKEPVKSGLKGTNRTEYQPLTELDGSWEVVFDPQWGGPAKTTFDRLSDWSQSTDERIKYYSGKATYSKTFDLPENLNNTAVYLDLGRVHELASVRLNGQNLGIIWTKPFRIELTSALKSVGNKLEIEVVNLWPNRLIGDEFLPEEKRLTTTNIRKFTKATQLLPSGLMGPVTLTIAKTKSQ